MIKTATNPDTGEKIALIDGKWVPIEKTATNPDTGEKAVLINGNWITGDTAPAAEDVDFDTMTMVGNIPSSTVQQVNNMYEAVRHPVQTEQAVSDLFQSTLKKGQRKVREIVAGVDIEPEGEEASDAAWEGLKQRYGSVERFQKTLMEDPAGVVLDLAVVGTATRPLRMSRLTQATTTLDPVNVAANTVKTAAKVLTPKEFPHRLYRNANNLKFPETLPHAREIAALDAGMANKLRSTWRGDHRLETITKGLNKELQGVVDDATRYGMHLDSEGAFRHLAELRRKKGGFKVEATKDLKTIDRIEDTVRGTLPERYVTPRQMQDFKSDAYKRIYDPSSGKKKRQTVADTYTDLSKGAKETLQEKLPAVAAINKKLGPLLSLKKPLKTASEILPGEYGNITRATIPAIGGAMATYLGGPQIGFATGLGLAAFTSPLAKSRLAMALRKLQKGDIGWLQNNLNATELRAVLAIAGRKEEEQEDY
jgi:hypothetical protein